MMDFGFMCVFVSCSVFLKNLFMGEGFVRGGVNCIRMLCNVIIFIYYEVILFIMKFLLLCVLNSFCIVFFMVLLELKVIGFCIGGVLMLVRFSVVVDMVVLKFFCRGVFWRWFLLLFVCFFRKFWVSSLLFMMFRVSSFMSKFSLLL